MLFFMCCYCGVYPWGLLRPRSTKTAATVLMQVHSDRRTPGVPMRLSNCGRKTDRKTSRGPPQRSTRRLKQKPAFYLCEKFEEFWASSHFVSGFPQLVFFCQ